MFGESREGTKKSLKRKGFPMGYDTARFIPSIVTAVVVLGAVACAPAHDEQADEGKPTPNYDEPSPGPETDNSKEPAAASEEGDPSLQHRSFEKGKSYDCCAIKHGSITIDCIQFYGLAVANMQRCNSEGGTHRDKGCGAYPSCDFFWPW